MNPTLQAPVRRRRIWPWILGICLTPFVLLAAVVASYLTLERDAAVLRQHVMAATDGGWHTKVQMSLGGLTLGAVRTGLCFVHGKDMADARLALSSVRHVSVGVYERTSGGTDWSREELFIAADKAMQKRGWTRLVGVADHKNTVLVYVSQDLDADEPVEICVAVIDGREMVVASTSVDPAALAELAERHSTGDLRQRLRLAKLRF